MVFSWLIVLSLKYEDNHLIKTIQLNTPFFSNIASMKWQHLISGARLGKKKEGNTNRSVFEQDYDRVIFSEPFRRLQDKTQVHPLPEQDFVHNRLTHSLEVSSVGRSLGKHVGEIILTRHPALAEKYTSYDFAAIVATASLAHDIGNPPFGHSGESAISAFFVETDLGREICSFLNEAESADLRNFEGNAQGFRLLNKKNYQGLQLTNSTLAAFTKYPRPSILETADKKRRSQKKFGYYQSESEVFESLATELNLTKPSQDSTAWLRHPLAYLVEAADDICYNIIDLEDGCRLNLISFNEARDLMVPIIGELYNEAKLNSISGTIEKLGMLRALTINSLLTQCIKFFVDHEKEILSGVFDSSLADEILAAPFLEEIKKISIQKIYRADHVVEKEAAGFEILPGLTSLFMESILERHSTGKNSSRNKTSFNLFPEDVRKEIDSHESLYLKVRSGLDFISGLTDRNALTLYRKIKGISVNL